MLEINDYLVDILACSATLAVCFAMILQGKSLSRLHRLFRSERDARGVLESDVAALLACSKNIGERLVSQGACQDNLRNKLDVIDLNRDSNSASSYGQVRKMIDQGMNLDEITQICDLSRGEVELLNHVASMRTAA